MSRIRFQTDTYNIKWIVGVNVFPAPVCQLLYDLVDREGELLGSFKLLEFLSSFW